MGSIKKFISPQDEDLRVSDNNNIEVDSSDSDEEIEFLDNFIIPTSSMAF